MWAGTIVNMVWGDLTKGAVMQLVMHMGLARDPYAKKIIAPLEAWHRVPLSLEIDESKKQR